MLTTQNPSKQQGISVLEVMLSLGIIAIILVMATRYYRSASISTQVSNGLSVLHCIVAAETNYGLANSNSYTTDISALIAGNYLPKNLSQDPWGGTISLAALPGQGIAITFPSVPLPVCNNLMKVVQSEAQVMSGSCGSDPGSFTAKFF